MMQPGFEMDKIVAEKVMMSAYNPVPWYSMKDDAAEEVLDKIKTLKTSDLMGYKTIIKRIPGGKCNIRVLGGGPMVNVTGETYPHAVCLAALKIAGVEI